MDLGQHLREIRQAAGPGVENLIVLDTVDSTNRFAQELASSYLRRDKSSPETVVIALHQAEGRGRRGRVWWSSYGSGVYASWLLPLESRDDLVSLPLLVAIALAEGINGLVGERVRLKWPNDLVIDRRKIGGILIETMPAFNQGVAAILGFGINVSQTENELPDASTASLRMVTDAGVSLAGLTGKLVASVGGQLQHVDNPTYAVDRYRELSVHQSGERMRCQTANGLLEGNFAGFDERGFLRLKAASGDHLLAAADVIEG